VDRGVETVIRVDAGFSDLAECVSELVNTVINSCTGSGRYVFRIVNNRVGRSAQSMCITVDGLPLLFLAVPVEESAVSARLSIDVDITGGDEYDYNVDVSVGNGLFRLNVKTIDKSLTLFRRGLINRLAGTTMDIVLYASNVVNRYGVDVTVESTALIDARGRRTERIVERFASGMSRIRNRLTRAIDVSGRLAGLLARDFLSTRISVPRVLIGVDADEARTVTEVANLYFYSGSRVGVKAMYVEHPSLVGFNEVEASLTGSVSIPVIARLGHGKYLFAGLTLEHDVAADQNGTIFNAVATLYVDEYHVECSGGTCLTSMMYSDHARVMKYVHGFYPWRIVEWLSTVALTGAFVASLLNLVGLVSGCSFGERCITEYVTDITHQIARLASAIESVTGTTVLG